MDYSILWIFGCPTYSLLIVEKKQTRAHLSSVSSSGLPKELRVSGFGISRKGAPLLAEMWSLMKNQCCKKCKRQRIKCKVELQTVR